MIGVLFNVYSTISADESDLAVAETAIGKGGGAAVAGGGKFAKGGAAGAGAKAAGAAGFGAKKFGKKGIKSFSYKCF